MFTLRKITGDGVELNFFLGKSYTLITQDRNPKEFEENRLLFSYEVGETYGFVYGEDGKMLALFPKQQNYIMVDGKTVDYLKYNKSELLPELKQKKNTLKRHDEVPLDVRYELFRQESPAAALPKCIGLRVAGMEDEIPLKAYGETVDEALNNFLADFKESNFVITMEDK